MRVTTAKVPTANASSYLRKLCQHWSHKFLVSFDNRHGTIDLSVANCILDAEEDALNVRLELLAEGDEARMQTVVEEHLKRFAFRETLVFVWNAAAEPATTA